MANLDRLAESFGSPIYGPYDEEALRMVETDLSVVISTGYRWFLKTFGIPDLSSFPALASQSGNETPHIQQLIPIEALCAKARQYWAAGLDEHLLPFATTAAGDILCLPVNGEEHITLYLHDLELSTDIAPDFETFIEELSTAFAPHNHK